LLIKEDQFDFLKKYLLCLIKPLYGYPLFISINLIAQDSKVKSVPINSSKASFGLNSEFSYLMMEPNQNLRKLKLLIKSKSEGKIADKSLTIGFSMIGLMDYQKSNTNSKFGYLMRHPTSNNQIGESVSEAVIHSSQISLTASLNNWITAYGELLYDPQQSFGAGSITALGRNQIQLRKGILVLGNLNKLPLYLSIGKMDIPFGQTGSVSPFTNSTMWHAYGVLSYGAILGFEKAGLNANIALIQGGAQFRAAHTPVQGTNIPSRLNNFSADLNYTFEPIDRVQIQLGGSYLKGTAYCQGFPVTHFAPCEESNSAFSYYGNITINDRLYIKASFATTQDIWPGTHNPNAPLDVFEAVKVSSLDYGAIYQINPNDNIIYSLSAEFSNFVSGAEGSPWERSNQIIVGLNAQIESTSRFFVELLNTKGYSPLNFISGGNFPDLGITHSVSDATSTGIVVGVLFTI